MSKLKYLFVLALMSSNAIASEKDVSMACQWTLYGTQNESFVFNLADKKVYWVNENKRLSISEVNEGRIVFEGVRSSLLVGDKTYKKDVKLKFTINRVTGELYIGGIKTPSGYNNICIPTKKVI